MNIENDKIITNKHKIFVIVGIILAALIVVGGTLAYILVEMYISNKNIASATTCFNVIYDADNDSTYGSPITGTLIPSSGPKGGLSGKITIGMDEDCDIDGYGNFYLNVTTGSDILFRTVDAHCENSQTLRTLVGYTEQASCEAQTNGVWVTDGTALKYAIYTTNTIDYSNTVPEKVGYINSLGQMSLYTNFSLLHQSVDYYVYIWLDGNLSDNSYANQSIDGDISATVSQVINSNQTVTLTLNGNGATMVSEIFEYSGDGQIFTAPLNGTYKLEVWGAQGGTGANSNVKCKNDYDKNSDGKCVGGYGGYSVGDIELTENDKLYVYVGGKGVSDTSGAVKEGGYNGGGDGYAGYSLASGGGATHIATVSGLLSSLEDNKSSILIVAGGGGGTGGDGNYGTTIVGHAGGYIGKQSECYMQDPAYKTANGGSQSSGGIGAISGSFGKGASAIASSTGVGGGGGYYGGGKRNYASGGGSGYIGNSLLTNKAMYCYYCTTTSDDPSILTYSVSTFSDVATSQKAKSGDGAAIISSYQTSMAVSVGSSFSTLPIPTRDGYSFLGWSTNKDAKVAEFGLGSIINFADDTTLYAVWSDSADAGVTYLFSPFNEHTDVTGGWSAGVTEGNGFFSVAPYIFPYEASATYYSIGDTMNITWPAVSSAYNTSAFYGTENQIDLTDVSTITVNLTATGDLDHSRICVMDGPNDIIEDDESVELWSGDYIGPYTDSNVNWPNCAKAATLSNGTVTLDVSELQGDFHILIGGASRDYLEEEVGSLNISSIIMQ